MRLDRLYNLPNLRDNIIKQKEAAMDKILEEEYGFKKWTSPSPYVKV